MQNGPMRVLALIALVLAFVITADASAIVVGKKRILMPADLCEIEQIAFVPNAVVIVHKVQTSSNEDGMGTWELELAAVPTPRSSWCIDSSARRTRVLACPRV